MKINPFDKSTYSFLGNKISSAISAIKNLSFPKKDKMDGNQLDASTVDKQTSHKVIQGVIDKKTWSLAKYQVNSDLKHVQEYLECKKPTVSPAELQIRIDDIQSMIQVIEKNTKEDITAEKSYLTELKALFAKKYPKKPFKPGKLF